MSTSQIWKFKLDTRHGQRHLVEMPMKGRVLSVQLQKGIPHLWAMVNPGASKETRVFVSLMTGQDMPNNDSLTYIGTCQIDWSVVHIFEVKGAGRDPMLLC